MNTQIDLFGELVNGKNKLKPINYQKEAKLILKNTGITQLPTEAKLLIAATLMREWFPDMHKTMLMMLATTSIKK